MKLLILGGTRFLGRQLASIALDRGHAVTLLHRGLSSEALFPEAEHLIADRDGDLAALGGDRRWDAVIDTSAYLPRQVRAVAARLAGRIGLYQLVSSISVYRDFGRAGITEDAETVQLADPTTESIAEHYGGLKRLCERAAQEAFGERCGIVRPGLIVGPHDPTGRFTWWLTRLARGGEVLAPGRGDAPVQFIDVRDLAAWMLGLAEGGVVGTLHASGPLAPLSFEAMLQAIAGELAPSGTRLNWIDEAWLLEQQVAPWSDLPLWLPAASQGMLQIELGRAAALGLACRPIAETARDTAAWALVSVAAPAAGDGPPRPAVGLAPDREAALLDRWHRASCS